MLRSHTILTIAAADLEKLYAAVGQCEEFYEQEYPDFDCDIKIDASEPNDQGRIAFVLRAPDGCGDISDHDIIGDGVDTIEEPAVYADELRRNPYCLSEQSFWVQDGTAIRYHHVGDCICQRS